MPASRRWIEKDRDSVHAAVSLTGLAAVALASAHLAGSMARAASARMRSFAGGVGVAYVFVIVLPLLSNWQRNARDSIEADRLIFLTALAGLSVYYIFAFLAKRLKGVGLDTAAAYIDQAGTSVYSACVGFVLADYGDRSMLWLIAYTAVIGLHFYMSARVIRSGRHAGRAQGVVLASAVLLGWSTGKVAPHRLDVAAFLFSAMAGAMMFEIFVREMPGNDAGVPSWFLLGIACVVVIAFGLRL